MESVHRGKEEVNEPAKKESFVKNSTPVTELSEERRLLDEVPLEVQEAWICEDLLFVLQVSSHETRDVLFKWLMSRLGCGRGLNTI